MRHITLVTPSFSPGGAERAVALLAEGFIKRGEKVSLVTIFGKETYFYDLPNGVNIRSLNIDKNSPTLIHGLCNNIYRLWVLRKEIISLQPDIVISFLDTTNILTLLSLFKTKYPVIVNEQNNPSVAIGNLWKALRRLSYPLAHKVVSSSQGVDNYFHWLPKNQRKVIYNPLAVSQDDSKPINLPLGVDPSKKLAIAMGRLTHQKGFDILLSAFNQIIDKYPDWQLIILGEGELRSELESKIEKLGLTSKVILPGLISNPFPLLKHSDLFVLSSRFEGFGNVLIEAMACGLPVISTDCPSGPREIIDDGVNGILVPNEDVSSLSKAMVNLMSSEQERKRLATHAPKSTKRFHLEKIITLWEELITEVI
jgi:glycosyltransferase involved in cell wall biosynthesis